MRDDRCRPGLPASRRGGGGAGHRDRQQGTGRLDQSGPWIVGRREIGTVQEADGCRCHKLALASPPCEMGRMTRRAALDVPLTPELVAFAAVQVRAAAGGA